MKHKEHNEKTKKNVKLEHKRLKKRFVFSLKGFFIR